MSYKSERRTKWLKYKKEDPFGMKARFIRDFIFRKFRSYANMTLNWCGWLFEEGSYEQKLWKLYHCDLEELEHIHGYKMKVYQEKHGRDFYPTDELREIFLSYLHRSYILFKKTLEFYPMHPSERDFYISWFEKNIRKYESIK